MPQSLIDAENAAHAQALHAYRDTLTLCRSEGMDEDEAVEAASYAGAAVYDFTLETMVA